MRQRVLTALALLPLAIGAVLGLPTGWFMSLTACVLLGGMWEWSRLAGLPRPHQRGLVLLLHASIMAALAHFGWPQAFPAVVAAGVLWWLLASAWLARPGWASDRNRGNALLKTLAGLFMSVPAWAAVALLHGHPSEGPRWLLFALALVWATDSAAYFVGSRLGRRRLAPAISPGKTWAGFWGGFGGALVLTLLAAPLLDVPHDRLPALGLLALTTALAAVVGDLFESLIKRHSGAKDSGAMIPGHGGMMDRLDSLLSALPVFALGRMWLGL